MRIIVTGSSGMLGRQLCKKLVDKHEVYGLDVNRPQTSDFRPQTFFKVDLSDRALAVQKIEEINPHIVIHCAAFTDVDACETNQKKAHQLNVANTSIVAEGCKLTSSYMIHLSTDFVFNGRKKIHILKKMSQIL